jgi:hypothetical protein
MVVSHFNFYLSPWPALVRGFGQSLNQFRPNVHPVGFETSTVQRITPKTIEQLPFPLLTTFFLLQSFEHNLTTSKTQN